MEVGLSSTHLIQIREVMQDIGKALLQRVRGIGQFHSLNYYQEHTDLP